tara:strand:+ start:702 stop:2396 length:1695 start_codon:yes stop_codon:yes gene_type:complete
MTSFADISNESNKKTCTNNIKKDYFDKTFFIENSNKYVNVYNKLSIIDTLDFDSENSPDAKNLGQGAFNTVKEFPLSKNCSETKNVAVRIRSLLEEKDYTIKDEKFELKSIILESIDNINDLSTKGLHPKVYEIKVVKKKKTNKHYLIIIMEKYMSSLNDFINTYRDNKLRGKNGIENFPEKGCPPDDKSTSPDSNHKLIIQLIRKTEKLIEDVANEGYFCYDIKPGNLVVNYNFKDEKIDVKMIDVDADFCVKDLHHTDQIERLNIDNSNEYKIFSQKKTYKYVMMILLSKHLNRKKFNYFAKYFWIFGQILETRYKDVIKNLTPKLTKDKFGRERLSRMKEMNRYKIIIETTGNLLLKIDNPRLKPRYIGLLSEVCKHYFNLDLKDVPRQIIFLENTKGTWMSFCLKNLCVQVNKQNNIVETFDTEFSKEKRKNKKIEAIPMQDEKDNLLQTDDESEAQPKNEGNKSDEYKEEEKERPDFDDLLKKIPPERKINLERPDEKDDFPGLPPVAPGKEGGKKRKTTKKGKKRTCKSRKSKKMTKKGKKKTKKVKRKVRKTRKSRK